jgi:hypothetical protein
VQQTVEAPAKQSVENQVLLGSISTEPGFATQPPQVPHVSAAMAYQRADQGPFSPRGFQPLEVHHREIMALAVINPSPSTHEEFTIVSITPLPTHAMQFAVVQDVIHEFLEDHLCIAVREIQPSHLG